MPPLFKASVTSYNNGVLAPAPTHVWVDELYNSPTRAGVYINIWLRRELLPAPSFPLPIHTSASGEYGIWRGYNDLLYISIMMTGDSEQPYLQWGTAANLLSIALSANYAPSITPAYKLFPLATGPGEGGWGEGGGGE